MSRRNSTWSISVCDPTPAWFFLLGTSFIQFRMAMKCGTDHFLKHCSYSALFGIIAALDVMVTRLLARVETRQRTFVEIVAAISKVGHVMFQRETLLFLWLWGRSLSSR